MITTTPATHAFLDGIDLDDDDDPMHIEQWPGSPTALCGHVFEDEIVMPADEVPDEACCPVCLRMEGPA